MLVNFSSTNKLNPRGYIIFNAYETGTLFEF